jgi:hypothetical protein
MDQETACRDEVHASQTPAEEQTKGKRTTEMNRELNLAIDCSQTRFRAAASAGYRGSKAGASTIHSIGVQLLPTVWINDGKRFPSLDRRCCT